MSDEPLPNSEIILYQTEDGRTRIQCRLEGETLWLTQAQIAELFQTSVPNINLHLKAIYAEGELVAEATIKSHLMVSIGASQTGFPSCSALQSARHPCDADFLRISGRKLLDHAGKISGESAKAKAELDMHAIGSCWMHNRSGSMRSSKRRQRG